jgi:RNA polymerase sigma-70 factor (ECF subfamily)
MIDEAERELSLAARARTPGRFQLEAAIQSVHAHRAMTGATDWESIALLYEELVHLAVTVGALVGRAAALGNARGPRVGLEALDEIAPSSVAAYQPYWAVRAHLFAVLGLKVEARDAYTRAIGLSEDEQEREFLATRTRSLNDGRNKDRPPVSA